MEKFCMFSTVLLCSLAGSAMTFGAGMDCCENAGSVMRRQMNERNTSHTSQNRGCVGHPGLRWITSVTEKLGDLPQIAFSRLIRINGLDGNPSQVIDPVDFIRIHVLGKDLAHVICA